MKKLDLLLIFPQLGAFDELVKDIPLSLIYAAADAVKDGFSVEILDLRLYGDGWQEQIDQRMKDGCFLVGLSVMTGNPIRTSLEVSKYIKSKYSSEIVWGGAHPTILPEQTLENEYIDYVIRDWGSKALCQLVGYVKQRDLPLDSIVGLGYKTGGQVHLNETCSEFEILDFRDIPYHLVDVASPAYNRLSNGEMIFPVFTAVGCPYKCTFCMSPAVYKKIKGGKWIPFEMEEVFQHMDYLLDSYPISRFQIYDDDSFVDIERMRSFFREYISRGYPDRVKLDFRGVRIDELDRTDDEFLSLMVESRVEIMAIGVESGSDRMLESMKKGITAEQIRRVNRKLARFPSLKPHYNFFCGIPGETMATLIETKNLLLQLVQDHPGCYLGVGADWKPLPGSVMTDQAVADYGLKLPEKLEEWADIDSFDAEKIVHPWYSREMDNMIRLLQIAGQALDCKLYDFKKELGIFWGNLLISLASLYRPILMFRLTRNFVSFPVEYTLKNWMFTLLVKTKSLFGGKSC
ncbi:hypothetical protein A7E78_01525 [Syntrophotalea acetylenivorans]|uniref:Uncharacterized protein n=1 Tax=Syntrophotalea acetylenivorans TaxID=1842532 RepID=A0A1L3GL75_9BACT|nr:radical SAM protein [Syntrophotalea acetylenivorans]APG26655.1 hypothetical protein A7E78_01525 [Syntrophotalea acetylenivorans]